MLKNDPQTRKTHTLPELVNVVKKVLDNEVWYDVANVLSVGHILERDANHVLVLEGGASRVSWINCRVNLNPQKLGSAVSVVHELYAADDALRHRNRLSSGWIPSNSDSIL